MADIEVERCADDRLSREVWRFSASASYSNNVFLTLQYYAIEPRASTRHKWRSEPARRWVRADSRAYNSGVKAEDVPLPADVAQQAKDLLRVDVLGAISRPGY